MPWLRLACYSLKRRPVWLEYEDGSVERALIRFSLPGVVDIETALYGNEDAGTHQATIPTRRIQSVRPESIEFERLRLLALWEVVEEEEEEEPDE